MTNNTDEFDTGGFDSSEQADEQGGGAKKNGAAWRQRPLFKLMIIMIAVAVAIAVALGVSSTSPVEKSNLAKVPTMNATPGGKASPYFLEQNKQAGDQRAEAAFQQGTSALPTPMGQQGTDIPDMRPKEAADPLKEFRAETERLKNEMKQQQQQSNQQIQIMQRQMQQAPKPAQQPEKEDNSLAQAMQKQMGQLMESWNGHSMKVVQGGGLSEEVKKVEAKASMAEKEGKASLSSLASASPPLVTDGVLVSAGTVNYAQILTEANSDIPGPILAQILSGPLAGGRAVGAFQVQGDYLVIHFNLVTLQKKTYSVNALALDPDTTLGGVATEVDHRYFDRVLLPAAGAFVQAFGQNMGQNPESSTVSNGVVVTTQARQSMRDAVYAGVGSMGQSVSQFLQQQASATKPLVRVSVGTPLGVFFLTNVSESGAPPVIQNQTQFSNGNWGNNGGMGYGAAGNNGIGNAMSNATPSWASGVGGNAYNALAAGYAPGYQPTAIRTPAVVTPGQAGYQGQ